METTFRAEARKLIALSIPSMGSQLGMVLLGVVDMLMIGQVGVDELSAASLGNIWVFGTIIAGIGLVFGLDPVFSQAHGAADPHRLGIALQRGFLVSLFVGALIGLLWGLTEPFLIWSGQDRQLSQAAADYTMLQIPGIVPFLWFLVLRHYLQGREMMFPSLWVMVLANLANVLLNWVLIYGNLGFPPLGLRGAAIATCITRVVLFVCLLSWIYCFGLYKGGWTGWSRESFRWSGIKEILGVGFPVVIQLSLEMWAFQMATVFAGRLGKFSLAAHTIVLNMASISFMLPLGLSFGAVTRVGNLLGARRPVDAQKAAWVSFLLGGGVMTASATIFVVFRSQLTGLYTDDSEVIRFGAIILPIAAAFQVFDGTQVVGGGILRGMGQTKPAALFNLVGYYVIALPVAWCLAFPVGLGIAGVWWGLCVGLGVVAALLVGWIGWRGPARLATTLSIQPEIQCPPSC